MRTGGHRLSTGNRNPFFVDYEQADIVVDGERMHSFPISATAENGLSCTRFQFQLADPPDPSRNHKLCATVLLDADAYASQGLGVTIQHGTAQNYDLCYAPENPLVEPSVPYESSAEIQPRSQATQMLLLHEDPDLLGEYDAVPEITCAPGEEILLHYRIGGEGRFGGAEAYAILFTVGLVSTPVNGQPYLLVQTPEDTPVLGAFTFTAPEKEGYYEIMAWAIHDPFSETPPKYSNHWLSPRFTLHVR